MSLTDRLNQAQKQRESDRLRGAPGEYSWERKQTSSFMRSTGSLSMVGESEIETLSRELGLSRANFAIVIGMSELMVERWERGLVQPSDQSTDRIAAIRQIHARLYAMFQPYQVLDWMRTANGELGWQTPVDALVAGRVHRVELTLDELEGLR